MKSFMEYSERNDDFYMAVAEMAMDMFNRQMGTDFSHENVEVCLKRMVWKARLLKIRIMKVRI